MAIRIPICRPIFYPPHATHHRAQVCRRKLFGNLVSRRPTFPIQFELSKELAIILNLDEVV